MPPNHIRIECANKLLSLLRPSKPPSVQKKNHREKCVRLQFIYTYIIYIYTHNKIKQLRPTQTSILDIVDHDGGGGTVIHKIKTHCKDSQTYKHIYIYIYSQNTNIYPHTRTHPVFDTHTQSCTQHKCNKHDANQIRLSISINLAHIAYYTPIYSKSLPVCCLCLSKHIHSHNTHQCKILCANFAEDSPNKAKR